MVRSKCSVVEATPCFSRENSSCGRLPGDRRRGGERSPEWFAARGPVLGDKENRRAYRAEPRAERFWFWQLPRAARTKAESAFRFRARPWRAPAGWRKYAPA